MRAVARAAIAVALVACGGPSQGEKVKSDVAEIKAERSPDKLVDRGLAFAQVGDLTRAEQYLAAALDAGADSEIVLPPLLKVCVQAKRFRVAIDYATPVLRKHPSDTHLRYVIASLRATVGDFLQARADMEQVVAQTPNDPGARYAYAVLLRDNCGDLEAADAQFRAYLALAPQGDHAEEARASLLKPVQARSVEDPSDSRELKSVP